MIFQLIIIQEYSTDSPDYGIIIKNLKYILPHLNTENKKILIENLTLLNISL